MEKIELLLKSSVFFVEANSFERHELWKQYHETTQWINNLEGFQHCVGYISQHKKKPVCIELFFCKIYDQRICFYSDISRFVDHDMIENWITTNYPVFYDETRLSMTDAMNFHHAIHRCKELGLVK